MDFLEKHDQQKQKIKESPCTCGAYKFPHRRYSGSCTDDYRWMDNTDRLRFVEWERKSERYK